MGQNLELRKKLFELFHSGEVGGHSGVHATRHRIAGLVYWKGLSKDIKQWVKECAVCQRCKYDNSAYPGLLQPLPVLDRAWTTVSLDFVEGLPTSKGKDTILVVIDRLTKYGHFIGLSHPFTAVVVAQQYLEQVYKLHGVPKCIISDCGKVFVSSFWQALFKHLGVKLHLSTADHPQTDGQTEVLNKCLEGYLRCMCGEKHGLHWLSGGTIPPITRPCE